MGSLTNLIYHVVFSTKHREALIREEIQLELHSYLGAVIRKNQGIVLEIGGTEDHVHILLKIRAMMSLSDMMREIKSDSSRWLNKIKNFNGTFGWQNGYGGFTVSASQVERVRAYVKNQKKHHQKNNFENEFLQFLEHNQLEYNPDYLWN